MKTLISPQVALFDDQKMPVCLPCVEHYAGQEKYISKALAIQKQYPGQIDVTLDCEDGAEIGHEREQAGFFGEVLSQMKVRSRAEASSERLGVRTHDAQSAYFVDDVHQILSAGQTPPSYWMIPKIRDLQQATEVIAQLKAIHQIHQLPMPPVHMLIETHGGLHDVYAIAQLKAVESLSFGLMDFVSAHHGGIPSAAMKSPEQFQNPFIVQAKLAIASACMAHGKVANHNVTVDFRSDHTTYEDAKRAKEMFGFGRMWSIHPNQIEQILAAFKVDETQLQLSASILQAAQLENWGPISVDHQLHDRASYRYHWHALLKAKAQNVPLPDITLPWFAQQP